MIALRPTSVSLELGRTQHFAVVPDQDVVWSQKPKNLGNLMPGGLYEAPHVEDADKAGQKVTIIATRAIDPTDVAKATVTLLKKLVVTPENVEVVFGQTQPFRVEPDVEVNWSIEPKLGSIDENGTYTAPAKNEQKEIKPRTSVAVIAESKETPLRTATATVTLVDFVVKAAQAEARFGTETEPFSVEPETAVAWSIDPQLGSIDEKGVYSAPSKDDPGGAQAGTEITVKATKSDESTSYATATITLRNEPSA